MAKASRGSSIEKYHSIFATRLRELIENTPNATQVQLAEVIGVSRQTVSQYANGISEPGYDALIKIANHFNVSLDYLLGRSETKTTDVSIQAACKTTGLSEASVRRLHAFATMNTDAIDGAFSEDYYSCNSRFAHELVNEFIDFAFCLNSEDRISFRDYISFRLDYSDIQKSAIKHKNMTYNESAEYNMHLVKIYDLASLEGFHPLFLEDSYKYFLTRFCDQYKQYLQFKYPLVKPDKPTWMLSMLSEEQNGND